MVNISTLPIAVQLHAARGREEHAREDTPPADNMGVKNLGEESSCANPEITFHVDYLRVTAWMDRETFMDIYDTTIGGKLGNFVDLEHGGRFYTHTEQAHLGTRFYSVPAAYNADSRQLTAELPGQACQLLGWEALQNFYIQLAIYSEKPISVPRLDLAFDNAPFTVEQFGKAVLDGDCRTYARRETFRDMNNPFQKRENGEVGCHTFYVGNRESLRVLRVYDKHGPVRVELELHDEKARQVAKNLFEDGCDPDWKGLDESQVLFERAMGHLRDFIDVSATWWEAFVNGIKRAYMKLTGVSAKELDASSIANYLIKQVACAYSVAMDVFGKQFGEALLNLGRERRIDNKKYQLAMA